MTYPIQSGNAAKPLTGSGARVRAADGWQPATHIVHLTSSRFFGGPERQMLELARELAPDVRSTFISFSETNLCRAFLEQVAAAGFPALALQHDTPHLLAAARELRQHLHVLRSQTEIPGKADQEPRVEPAQPLTEGVQLPDNVPRNASVLCVHGYKAGLLGLWTGRRCGIPVVAVSRGWTGEDWKVRFYEWLDRQALRRMDRVVCVSHGQAAKVRQAGVAAEKITVIHNAIRTSRFEQTPAPADRQELEAMFPKRPAIVIGAAGRLSPEKGFDVFIDACQRLTHNHPDLHFGVVLFGTGALQMDLQQRIDAAGLGGRFVLAGFCDQLDRRMPHFDLFVQSSHTEGLPNVLLEAAAAGVPVVATNVGGTAEVVRHEQTGIVVPAGSPGALADGIYRLATDQSLRASIRWQAPHLVLRQFTFAAQANAYRQVLQTVLDARQPTSHFGPDPGQVWRS